MPVIWMLWKSCRVLVVCFGVGVFFWFDFFFSYQSGETVAYFKASVTEGFFVLHSLITYTANALALCYTVQNIVLFIDYWHKKRTWMLGSTSESFWNDDLKNWSYVPCFLFVWPNRLSAVFKSNKQNVSWNPTALQMLSIFQNQPQITLLTLSSDLGVWSSFK